MRERLVELLKETFEYTRGTCIDFDEAVEINADHLLANGAVIIDPQKYPPVNNQRIIKTILGVSLEEMAELIDAKKEGRIIVPPCKVGDTVYSIQECSCEDIDGVHTECEFYGYGEDDRICTIPNGAKCPHQYRIVGCYVTEMNILWFTRNWCVTAFPTREEAEKALKGGE